MIVDCRSLYGKVDGGVFDARQLVEALFNPVGASRTRHAGNCEFGFFRWNLIAERFDFLSQLSDFDLPRIINDF